MERTAPGPRLVDVHQAKDQLSHLMDAAHNGETIVLTRVGKPWAKLMPLEAPAPQRLPGRLRRLGPLSQPNELLQPMPTDHLADWQGSLFIPAPSLP